jgi:hypothetical protein
MPVQDKDGLAGGTSWNSIAGGLLMFTLMLVFMVWLGLYVNDGFESLEEKLGDQAAAGGQTIGNGAYGIEIVEGQTVYVPVYSHIYANGGQPHLLEATLSIRNLDPKRAITIKSVKYFDTKGALLKEYLDGEMELAALATAGFLVEKWDTRGGSGANFIVVWDAEEPVYEPLIEAVMVGFSDANSISFTSPGRALIERKEQTDSTP